jgi:hypothetical protein
VNRALHPRKDVIAVRRTQPAHGTVVAVGRASLFVPSQSVTFAAHAGVEFKAGGETLLLLSDVECTRYTRDDSGSGES